MEKIRKVKYLIAGAVAMLFGGELSAQNPDSVIVVQPFVHPFDSLSSYSVGRIPMEASVSPTGAKIISIPIEAVSVRGVSPEISLIYNSQGGLGAAGFGWEIGGLSAITIEGKNRHYDGETAPLSLTDETKQRYLLDGIRLIENPEKVASGSGYEYTPSGYQYETATGYIKVRSYHSGPCIVFSALSPDGSKSCYGDTYESGTQTAMPVIWRKDGNGNGIFYEYVKSGNTYCVSRIRYGSTTSSTCPGEIFFTYSDVVNPVVNYRDGVAISRDKQLMKIETYCYGEKNREYRLIHTDFDGNPMLTEMHCRNGAGDELPPALFSYNGYSADQYLNEFTGGSIHPFPIVSNDVEIVYRRGQFIPGDYGEGLIIYPGYTVFGYKTSSSVGYKYPESENILITKKVEVSGTSSTSVLSTAERGFQDVLVADIDGDGVDEAIKINIRVYPMFGAWIHLKVYRYENGGFIMSEEKILRPGGGSYLTETRHQWYVGDYLGNGKDQLLSLDFNQSCSNFSTLGLYDVDEGTILCQQSFIHSLDNSTSYESLDYDGDGRKDILFHNGSTLSVYSYDQAQNRFEEILSGIQLPDTSMKRGIWGDINGDGLLDLAEPQVISTEYNVYIPVWAPLVCPECGYRYPVRSTASTTCENCHTELFYISGYVYEPRCRVCNSLLDVNKTCLIHGATTKETIPNPEFEYNAKIWDMHLNTGRGFTTVTRTIARQYDVDKVALQDIDSDGLSDMVIWHADSLRVFLNHGSYFVTESEGVVAISTHGDIVAVNHDRPFEAAGILIIHQGAVKTFLYNRNLRNARLLKNYTDSFGVRNEVTYVNQLDYPTTYKSEYEAASPNIQKLFPLMLVHWDYIYGPDEEIYGTHCYEYDTPIVNTEGLGFRGFVHMKDEDFLKDAETVFTFDPVKGVPVSISSPRQEVELTWNLNERGDTENFNSTYVLKEDTLTGVVTTTSSTYDGKGNVTSELTTYYPGGSTRQRDISYQNSSTVSLYYSGLPATILETVSSGEESFTTKKRVYYSGLHPIRSYESVSYNGAAYSQTADRQWTYDSSGNVLSESVKPYNVTVPLVKSHGYDSDGFLLLTVTDEMGFTTTYSGHNSYGIPTEITDHKNRTTEVTYDDWGRKTGEAAPDGRTTSQTLSWSGSGLYKVEESASGEPAGEVHYDALGREVRKGIIRYDGSWQWQDTRYDSLGRVSRMSLPYKGSTPSLWTRRSYDSYDRPIRTLDPSGREETWSYEGLSVTHTKEGIVSTQTQDVMGRLVSATDEGGTLTYSLRADGKPKNIKISGSMLVSFEYDKYGRRSKIIDRNAGTRKDSVVYFSSGASTVYHTNPSGSVNRSYDRYGRLTHVNRVGEYHTFYTYNEDGLLTNESNTNNNSRSYTYDSYDRVTQVVESAPGTSLTTDYTYNNDGRPSSVQYTSSGSGVMATEQYTYANGWNTRIALSDGTTIWQLTGENALGQVTGCTTGEITRTYGYDQYGMPTYRQMDGGLLQDETYMFSAATGNLAMRTDGIHETTEAFGYDNLNRLTSVGNNHNTYQNNGNIATKSGVGTYGYGSGLGNTVNRQRLASLVPYAGVQLTTTPREITYTCFDRPKTIEQGTVKATFTYNGSDERIVMNLKRNNVDSLTRYYLGGRYEVDVLVGKTVEKLYLGGDYYSAPMVYVKDGNMNWTLYNLGRDYLGSITLVTTAGGFPVAEYSYDAWGCLRNPENLTNYTSSTEPVLFTGRGYTGHEHLRDFGLINMNARLYDPVLGRFISPDPYVQTPDFTQCYNRYSYALNNPLRYKDPSGELTILGSFLNGLWTGGWKRAWKMAKNDALLWIGLFNMDPNRGVARSVWDLFTRFTWQIEQTLVGFLSAQTMNTFHIAGGVENVSFLHGTTVVSTKKTWGDQAFTISNFIMGGSNLEAANDNYLFQHEFGHYLQSKRLGPFYFSHVGLPSLGSKGEHSHNKAEQDANRRAFKYLIHYYPEDFDKYKDDGQYGGKWHYDSHPIYGIDWYHYKDKREANQKIWEEHLLRVTALEAILRFTFVPDEPFDGWINRNKYNHDLVY